MIMEGPLELDKDQETVEHVEDVKAKHKKKIRKRRTQRHVVTVCTTKADGPKIEALKSCIERLGLKQVPHGQKVKNCDIHWHAFKAESDDTRSGMHSKFPGMRDICGKMSLYRTLDFLQDLFPLEFDFYPKTWYLPAQLDNFQSDVKKLPRRRRFRNIPVYIVKPDSGSQGEGIFLIRDPKDYRNFSSRSHVVQEYMSNVYIIDGFKFDFRIYAVIKSLEPLEFYICTEGLARFSTVPYKKPNIKNIQESFMHLTNYSLNKSSSGFDRSENEDEGSKRTLTSIFNRLEQDGHDSGLVWKNIEEVVCKTILALVPEIKIQYRAATSPGKKGPSCFQIVGLDILLLDDLTPVLLEVNANPSLMIDSEQEVSPGVIERLRSPKDEEIKLPLITDTLRLVIPPHKLQFCLERRRKRLERNKVTEKNPPSDKENSDKGQGQDVVTMISEMNVEDVESKSEDVENESKDVQNKSEDVNETKVIPEKSIIAQNNKEESNDINQYGGDQGDQEGKEDEDEDSDDEEEGEEDEVENSCLKEIYPNYYCNEYEKVRIVERVVELFITGQGMRGSSNGITGSGFRTLARKCKLETHGISNAEIDVLYVSLKRKWDLLITDLMTGLCFKGFLEGCLEISQRIFGAESAYESLLSFLNFCEMNLSSTDT